MSLKDDVLFLGLGNCGSKIVKEFSAFGYKTMFANGSEQDIKVLGSLPNIYKLKNFDGFGGRRERAFDCLQDNDEFLMALQNIKEKIIFVAYGGGGSTGSGLSGIVCEYLLDENENKIVCPIVALPAISETIIKHKNAYDSVLEQQEISKLGASFFLNNNSSNDLNWVNNTFAKMLNVFVSNNSYGSINNFDSSEKVEMLREFGAMCISLVGKGDKGIMIDKLVRNGIFAPIQPDKRCEHIGIIHAADNTDDIQADMVIAEVGKPLNVYEGFNGGSTLISASGLTYPIDHLNKLAELARQANEERLRNRTSTSKLNHLDLKLEAKQEESSTGTPIKKPTKLQIFNELRAKQKNHV